MRLLMIEDDPAIARSLKSGLKADYSVEVAHTGREGLDQAEANHPDVAVLDLGLPDMSGMDVCRELRTLGLNMPILILTANSRVSDKVVALDYGADDYLTKPFSLVELRARLRALLRRGGQSYSAHLAVGDLVLDPARRVVERQRQEINLRRKEYDLLEYLMRNAGKVVTRTMILDHVWEANAEVWTNSVDVHVKYLRDKVDRPFNRRLIKTIHGVGYKIEA